MMLISAAIALMLDIAIGWPQRWFRAIGHPVVWLGSLISWLDNHWNGGTYRVLRGTAASLVTIAAAVLPAMLVCHLLGAFLSGLLAWPLLAARSLHDHLRAVARPLGQGDLAAGRHATAMIVGRDVTQADEATLSRAAIESLAENASDGVIAPLFWAAVAGLPGIAAYKAINTLDSMIGHRTARHDEFGRFAARLDDVANWIPARLTALLFIIAGRCFRFRAIAAEARTHRSVNAGWPEAAMAYALDVRLSGPRVYGDRVADEPWLNGTAPDPDASAIEAGLRLYRRAIAVSLAVLLTGFLLLG